MDVLPSYMVPVFVGGEVKLWARPCAFGTTIEVPFLRERPLDAQLLRWDELAPTAAMQSIVCRLGCVGWAWNARERTTYYAYVDDREPDRWLYRGWLTAVWALSALG